MQETQVQSLGREDHLEEEMATSFIAWEIPWTWIRISVNYTTLGISNKIQFSKTQNSHTN